jgi:uncharacterized protein RhaS with RHS repeats
MYWPALGRFLQTDPVGSADDLNLYAYVGNNPINFSDPLGLAGCSSSNLAQTLGNWWNATVAGFKSVSPVQAASRVLDGLPVEAAAIGAIGAIKGVGRRQTKPGRFLVRSFRLRKGNGGRRSAWI